MIHLNFFDNICADEIKNKFKEIPDIDLEVNMMEKFKELWPFIEDLYLIFENAKFKLSKDKDRELKQGEIMHDIPPIYVDGSYNFVNNKIGYGG